MSVKKFASSPVAEPDITLSHWEDIHRSRINLAPNIKQASINLKEFLLTHATILSGVACEDGLEDWLIKPESSHLVNNNEDAFENTVVKLSYPTFRGAFNFQEHYQNSKAKKGYIVDAVLRKIYLGDGDVWVYYCDILVATDLRNEKLVEDIRSKKVRYLSMGCVTDLITCSYCGAHNGGEGPTCAHTANSKGRFLPDRDGIPRRVAELCFPPSARVVMGDGSRKSIGDVVVGDTVFSHTGTRRIVTQTFQRQYAGPVVALQVTGLPQVIQSTPNHPYWVMSPRMECQCGCKQALGSRQTKYEKREYTRKYLPGHNPHDSGVSTLEPPQFQFKPASELRVGDFVALPIPQGEVIPVDVDELRAEILGWFLAEGSYTRYKGTRVGVDFTLNAEDELGVAARLEFILPQAFPPENGRQGLRAPKIYCYPRKEGGQKLTVRYRNAALASWCFQHAGEYAAKKRLSPDAVLWPVPVQRALLKAFVNGDGQTDNLSRHGCSSISETLISQLQIVAARCGLWTRRQVIFRGKADTLVGTLEIDGSLPRDSSNFRPLHTLHFQPSSEATQFFGMDTTPRDRGLAPAWRQHDGYMLYRVKSVAQESYVGPVHNFEVKEDHSYLVEGIAVHNCGHKSMPGGGVKFVEASWVARPAFPGAAGRSFIEEAALPDVKVASDLLALPGTRKVASELLTPVVDEWGHVAPAEMRRLR